MGYASKTILKFGTALLFLQAFAAGATAQTVQKALDELAAKPAGERQAFLEEKAKQDGKVVVYAADDPNVMRAWEEAFHAKYPEIKVEYVRMSTKDMLQRVEAETAAGRPVASLLGGITASEINYLMERGMLASYHSPEAASFPPSYADPDGKWTVHWLMPEVTAFNTDTISKEDVPVDQEKLWGSDFAAPIGRLQSGGRWLAGYASLKGEGAAAKLADAVVAKKPQLFQSNSDLTNALTAGQIAVAADMHAGNVAIAADRGAPVDYVLPEPLPILPAYTVFLADAPNPYAAALNYDWRIAKDGGQSFYKKFHQFGPREDTEYDFADVATSGRTLVPLTDKVLATIGQYDTMFREKVLGK
ncbi:ABC transporter substrate-binding protein [Aquamicrobium soli]|jgi:iron(III) transport system substrate-binding protein|uniref:ABC transporter substrate-binding protein n=1 Tax=Aquamicrobium soli TaxID=1811518 RepID=A0ABV7K7L1_9HYPH